MPGNIGIILLAAGSSSRMGQSKQLLELNGEPLLRNAVNVALASDVKKVVVVLGAFEKEHKKIIQDLPVNIIHNPRWETGMGSSLKAGLNYLIHVDPKLSGTVILVCDQPLLQAGHIKSLIETNQKTKKAIVASRYAQTLGVPAFFEKKYFSELLSLGDPQGAKKVIQQHPEDVSPMDFPEGKIDLDTPEDYQGFKRNKK
jgi:molybdenum cofactor cytidylyltransferase